MRITPLASSLHATVRPQQPPDSSQVRTRGSRAAGEGRFLTAGTRKSSQLSQNGLVARILRPTANRSCPGVPMKPSKIARLVLLVSVAALVLSAVALPAFATAGRGPVSNHPTVGGVDLGGMTEPVARQAIVDNTS